MYFTHFGELGAHGVRVGAPAPAIRIGCICIRVALCGGLVGVRVTIRQWPGPLALSSFAVTSYET